MKNIVFAFMMVIFGMSGMIATTSPLQAADCCCQSTTEEVCRRYFCKTRCFFGRQKTVHFVEITYKTTDRCGRCTIFKEVHRCH